MKLQKLIENVRYLSSWTTGKVFICYSPDKIRRMQAEGKPIAEGESFKIEDLTKEQLDLEVRSSQWWIEDGDLCIDPKRSW